jgi:IS5 family transposase
VPECGGRRTKHRRARDADAPRILLTGGQVHESRTAEVLLDGAEGNAVIADKAYDSNAIRDVAKAAGMKAVIPSNPSRKRRAGCPRQTRARFHLRRPREQSSATSAYWGIASALNPTANRC